ncbi:MAG: spore germination protein [Oscillospiraceae bacterium]|nr:spore germination protein [Oscillospiraceae bacterium]
MNHEQGKTKGYRPPHSPPEENRLLESCLQQNLDVLRRVAQNTSDLVIREFEVSGIAAALVLCEGMFSLVAAGQNVLAPLSTLRLRHATPQKLLEAVRNNLLLAVDQGEIFTVGEVYRFIMSGFGVLLIDGVNCGVRLALQGFSFRSVSEPSGEVNLRGSREGFTEPLRINMSLIRRRIKSPSLKFELLTLGTQSKTDAFLVYLTDAVSSDLLQRVKSDLKKVNLEQVLDTGYLQPFLERRRPLSFFSGIGITERPDTACAKISEGRVVLLLDGTPMALVLPYLFSEHFQSFDDYALRPYYALFIRCLKYLAFFMTILLPGTYVAVGTFHPQLLPRELLYNITASMQPTPFSLMTEALLIHFFYEVMREAGLRLPRPVGHAVSIAGGLVIGDVAVKAGLIGTPLVLVVALTAISAFVVPTLYEPVTVLRFLFILAGGFWGLFGIGLGFALVLCNLCALTAGQVPVTAPGSPLRLYSMRDMLFRQSWAKLGQQVMEVNQVPGSRPPTPKEGSS